MSRDYALLRRLEKRMAAIEKGLGDAHQRLARTVLHGKVSSVRKAGQDWQVRLELGTDPESGAQVLSPWVPVQPASAGAMKIKVKPTVGERMTLLSPSGVVGSGSWAMRGPFDDDHPAPDGDEDVVIERGASRIAIQDGKIVLTTGAGRIELDGGNVRVNGKTALTGNELTHNDKDISASHRHGGVEPGTANTGPPA